MKKNILFIFIFFMAFGGTLQAAVPAGDCPVMPGNKVKQKFYADYQGKRFYFCCRACVKKFKKNPLKYVNSDSN